MTANVSSVKRRYSDALALIGASFGIVILAGVLCRGLDPILIALPLMCCAHLIVREGELNKYPPQNLIKLLKSYYKWTFPNSLILFTLIIGIIQINPPTAEDFNLAVKLASYSVLSGITFGGFIILAEIRTFGTLEELLEKRKNTEKLPFIIDFLLFLFLMHVVYLGLALSVLTPFLSHILKR